MKKVTVKSHKRVGKNKVTVVKQHQRLQSIYSRGQHPNTKRFHFQKKSNSSHSSSGSSHTIHSANKILSNSQGTAYDSSQFSDTGRKNRKVKIPLNKPYSAPQSKTKKKVAPKVKKTTTSKVNSYKHKSKTHSSISRARMRGRNVVANFFGRGSAK